MRQSYLLWIALYLSIILLAACGKRAGVVAFSPHNERVAVRTSTDTTGTLYTTDTKGSDVIKIASDTHPAGVSFDPSGERLLYTDSEWEVCIANTRGGDNTCLGIPTTADDSDPKLLSFLPNGDFVLFDDPTLAVYHPDGTTVIDKVELDHIFLPPHIYKGETYLWRLKLYYSQQPINWVTIQGKQAFRYRATTNGLEGPVLMPRQIGPEVQDLLKGCNPDYITSRSVSPDGSEIVFQTAAQSETDDWYNNLYALDMTTNRGGVVQLVKDAEERVKYAFSPDGNELVYESNVGGHSVWIANADGSNPRKLADNASLPQWHPSPGTE